MFLPATRNELNELGWKVPDVILITGDAYVDSPFFGPAIIGKYLLSLGYTVAIIPQPDIDSDEIGRLGEPRLFWGVTAGCVDSMVSNYTPLRKRRNDDDLTAGGKNIYRPDRASIGYTNAIRRLFKKTAPVVLGGIEASLRRVAHYDYWDNRIRRSILLDAKADIIVYGMGERSVAELADRLNRSDDWHDIRGISYIGKDSPADAIELPSYEECSTDKKSFERMFKIFSDNCDPVTAQRLVQKHGERYLIQNPPQYPLSPDELDEVYNLEYERESHPIHLAQGPVKALETIRFSITTHRGCYGECSFCAIALHQGREVVSRSEESILREVDQLTHHPRFKGLIFDLGGPTANMYGFECSKKSTHGACADRHCLYPVVCKSLNVDHIKQMILLEKVRTYPGVKKVFVASGVRYDLLFSDQHGEDYLRQLVAYHVSGQMKIAPEHTSGNVLRLMRKPPRAMLVKFKKLFDQFNEQCGKKQFLTYYFIAAHPGSTQDDMVSLASYARSELKHRPEQVQIFTPTPSTLSTLVYYTGSDPDSGEPFFVERDLNAKMKQKDAVKGNHTSFSKGRRR